MGLYYRDRSNDLEWLPFQLGRHYSWIYEYCQSFQDIRDRALDINPEIHSLGRICFVAIKTYRTVSSVGMKLIKCVGLLKLKPA